MPKTYSVKEVVKTLGKAGFYPVSQKGSHIKYRGFYKGKLQTAIVPNHKELARGTFYSILSQANMTQGEFEEIARKKRGVIG